MIAVVHHGHPGDPGHQTPVVRYGQSEQVHPERGVAMSGPQHHNHGHAVTQNAEKHDHGGDHFADDVGSPVPGHAVVTPPEVAVQVRARDVTQYSGFSMPRHLARGVTGEIGVGYVVRGCVDVDGRVAVNIPGVLTYRVSRGSG